MQTLINHAEAAYPCFVTAATSSHQRQQEAIADAVESHLDQMRDEFVIAVLRGQTDVQLDYPSLTNRGHTARLADVVADNLCGEPGNDLHPMLALLGRVARGVITEADQVSAAALVEKLACDYVDGCAHAVMP